MSLKSKKITAILLVIIILMAIYKINVLEGQVDESRNVEIKNFDNDMVAKVNNLILKYGKLSNLVENMTHKVTQKDLVEWTKTIKGRKVFSQNDEDGAIEAVFQKIGTKDKVYVEFGVESCVECNSRYLRENLGWDVKKSLLLDGGNDNPDINLKKVIFWPDNILELFTSFHVKKQFDFLSVDTDSYDFFMLEAILEGGYRPRAIMVEYNANFELNEAKSIMKPKDGKSWTRWDRTRYHGMSLLAAKYLMERFHYSMVWCNKVNCMGVLDSELGSEVRLDLSQLEHGRLDMHKCDDKRREMAMIGSDGKWTGETDRGSGSPHMRC